MSRNRPITMLSVAVSLRIVLSGGPSVAAPGDLDTGFAGFGTGGKINTLGFGGSGVRAMALDTNGWLVMAGTVDATMRIQRRSGPKFVTKESIDVVFHVAQTAAQAYDVAIAPDGKIVVSGTVTVNGETVVAVARLNPDFTLDSGFDEDGTVIATFDNAPANLGEGVAVQDDRKIVVVGTIFTEGAYEAGVLRLNEDGSLDSTFHEDGRITYNVSTFTDANSVAIQPDQRIVVAGGAFDGGDSDFSLVRLTPTGDFDDTFDDDGIVTIGFGGSDRGEALALGPNGEIVVAGTRGGGGRFLARVLPNGELDESFDGDGRLEVGSGAEAADVIVQPDGKVVLGSSDQGLTPAHFVLQRFDFDGTPDATFGTGGEVNTTFLFPSGRLAGIALQPDGMIVAAGSERAARHRWDGSLDEGGIASIGFAAGHTGSEASALAVQSDGKLVAAGKVFVADYDMALARFTPSGSGLDVTFGTESPKAGRVLVRTTGPSEEIRAVTLNGGVEPVAAGQVFSTSNEFFVARFQENGAPAPECNGTGITTVDFGGSDGSASAVYIRPLDTRIYAAGTTRGTTEDYALVRLVTDTCAVDQIGGPTLDLYKTRIDVGGGEDLGAGLVVQNFGSVIAGSSAGDIVLVREEVSNLGLLVLDTSFGTSGHATVDTGYTETAAGLTEQADGSLVVAGTVDRGGTSDFVVARLNLHGAPDFEFGNNGVAFADFNTVDTAQAVGVRADGAIAVAGCTTTANGTEFAVAQFTADGDLDTAFSEDGKATLRVGSDGQDCARAVSYAGNQRLVLGGYAFIAGVSQFALAAFETTAFATVSTTSTTTTTVTTTTVTTTTTSLTTSTTATTPTSSTSTTTTTTGSSTTTSIASSTTTTTTTASPTSTTTLPSGACGDPNDNGNVTASDALFVLRAAVASETCRLCVCDTDQSGEITASDALRVLRVAVGQDVALDCPIACAAA